MLFCLQDWVIVLYLHPEIKTKLTKGYKAFTPFYVKSRETNYNHTFKDLQNEKRNSPRKLQISRF